MKRRSKVQEKNMSCERGLNFDQWKTFFEDYKPMRVWLWLVYKFTDNYCGLRLFSYFIYLNLKEVAYLSWQNRYHNLKTTCQIKLNFFSWTKLLERLLLKKYLISVAVSLIKPLFKISLSFNPTSWNKTCGITWKFLYWIFCAFTWTTLTYAFLVCHNSDLIGLSCLSL